MESNNNSKKNKIIKNKKEEKKTDFPKNKIVNKKIKNICIRVQSTK